ncbi:MAG: phosphoglycerate kinase [Nitrososphaerota archaeon]|jgi:phosphoglycerate kinase|uniref:phosphoglycerate kinase n=1 Tax=Candidatus Bathycorpusculum sp. TaxID=2994959 RepID=UPI0028184F54|nr:phosphoglycerate kinase [Candidatus Termitimicrobium sp.]MCL2431845.1 phosphoglycerate kinase [Candidatus Termitimicrobium sp.]MDR0492415.1 phosphoglycerate kinase [Nitrososphaerota archaeon]
MAKYKTLDDFDVKNKTVIVRVDFNSEIDPQTKKVTSDVRIRAHAESTLKELTEKGAKVVVITHQGRKNEEDYTTLKTHTQILQTILQCPIKYVEDVFGKKAQTAIQNLQPGEILVLENVRSWDGETKNGTPDQQAKTPLVQNIAPLSDLFVNDAFSTAHRSHASMVGFTAVLPSAAGRIMEHELKSLSKILEKPEHPCVYVMGGSKAEDSLEISRYVLGHHIADDVLVGGVTAQLFLAANNVKLGKAVMDYLNQKELTQYILGIKELIEQYPQNIKMPSDVALNVYGDRCEIPLTELPTNYAIYDIGNKTVADYAKIIANAKSIVVSGPMGVYENPQFNLGTKDILTAIANSKAFSLAGGGNTIAAIEEYGLTKKFSYISTAGGAITEFLMGKELPGVKALETATQTKKI